MKRDLNGESIALHRKHGGKIETGLRVPLENALDLSLAYTPGVAAVCREIMENPQKSLTHTWRGKCVAVVTDGSAVLGLGNIGALAAMPVMEGKAAIFKRFGGVDAVPICLNTQNVDEIVSIVQRLEPSFGGINLEDISAPRCFEIEERLCGSLSIPVFHDDQHGTAIVTLAALENSLKIVGKKITGVKIVLSGAGAAGIAVAKLLRAAGADHIILCDSRGAISPARGDLNDAKKEILEITNPSGESGDLKKVLAGADVFIGVSAASLLDASDIGKMAGRAIVFAMANPDPEILPDAAKAGGAAIVATGRSDFPNQVNNALAFPGLFRGAFEAGARRFTREMFLAASKAIADFHADPGPGKILPNPFDAGLAEAVSEAVKRAAARP
jgi:malate dehydrogenase (oxaloacetate-decarboxylating)